MRRLRFELELPDWLLLSKGLAFLLDEDEDDCVLASSVFSPPLALLVFSEGESPELVGERDSGEADLRTLPLDRRAEPSELQLLLLLRVGPFPSLGGELRASSLPLPSLLLLLLAPLRAPGASTSILVLSALGARNAGCAGSESAADAGTGRNDIGCGIWICMCGAPKTPGNVGRGWECGKRWALCADVAMACGRNMGANRDCGLSEEEPRACSAKGGCW